MNLRRFGMLLMFLTLVACGGTGTDNGTDNNPAQMNPPAKATGTWLATSGNHIVTADGTVWVGRGANLHDTRSCGAATTDAGEPLLDNNTGVAEVKRRIDTLTGEWNADYIRLALESRRTQDNYLNDANYRALVKEIVDYIGTKPGVYVMVSIWIDTSLDGKGLPTDATNAILAQLAKDFYDKPYVMFGVSNEPEENYDGAQDAVVWSRMNSAVDTIRTVEAGIGGNRHIISVQGTREWARDLSYYVSHPITAGGGINVAYETHVYNAPTDYADLFINPGKSIPVIIGEYGPINDEFHKATLADIQLLMDQADAAQIPHLAWTFHQFCSPNLIADKPGVLWSTNTESDGIDMPLVPTDFGTLLKAHLQK